MKVILTEYVPNLGEAGDVHEVADGFARNYLLPQGMAVVATEGALKQLEQRQAALEHRQEEAEQDAKEFAETLAGTTLRFQARVTEGDRLYGSITSADIAEALEAEIGRDIDRRTIELDEPLKELGRHRISIRLMPEVVADVTAVIEPQEAEEAAVAVELEEETAEAEEPEGEEPEEE